MNLVKYYKSISTEMMSMKDRIRNIINEQHWLTDGEWKESVLRSVLKRHMPENVGVGRGFVISDSGSTTQIDILLYDTSYPILFRDGDLVFVTPQAVKGIIEVKSKANYGNLRSAFNTLAENSRLIKSNRINLDEIFTGYFAYEKDQEINEVNLDNVVFNKLQEAYMLKCGTVNHVCIGDEGFYKYWEVNPDNADLNLNAWRAYNLNDSCIAYFINNLLNYCSNRKIDSNPRIWFQFDEDNPNRRKEEMCRGERVLMVDDNHE